MKQLVALLQFTTIFPLGKPVDFDNFAKNSWIYPIAGYVTGAVCMIPALLAYFMNFNNSFVIAAITIALAVLISGANHFDGLLDFGDGLMAHGSQEKRITAMTDRTTGAGALALGIMVILISFASLASLPVLWIGIAVFFAEVLGKTSMGLFSALGKPFHDGIQKYIYDLSKRRFCVYTLLLTIPLFILPDVRIYAIVCVAGLLITFTLLLLTAKKLFGGVNGDVTGASNEIVKMVVFVLFAVLASAC